MYYGENVFKTVIHNLSSSFNVHLVLNYITYFHQLD